MQKFIILHSNDIHGRIDGLARIATLVERVRAENPDRPVLYLDAGDSEETSIRLSNLTKGVAMYRLLRVAGCAVRQLGMVACRATATTSCQSMPARLAFPSCWETCATLMAHSWKGSRPRRYSTWARSSWASSE